MMKELTYHGACGKGWIQKGNRTGHCAKCHETFEGLTIFDAHQKIQDDGSVICQLPSDMIFAKEPLRFIDGTWRGPAMPQTLLDSYTV